MKVYWVRAVLKFYFSKLLFFAFFRIIALANLDIEFFKKTNTASSLRSGQMIKDGE